ncbi:MULTISPECIES: antibiotic biosynthesis monooxygenase [unclassified Streptomyces]|uniref:antibiotic biosynthesis monooxygenase family protein n=1 Tax=unclassified Streptomyces TaxID=2593676 RepID=UPI002E2DE83E|nr:antibiotic biosynthesis monooxygenase [Streptomyces sp. NBC_00190]WSZ45698.1 antibiotic biosynthesis monooxygenase [Streptomyces sp. NBC_00868]
MSAAPAVEVVLYHLSDRGEDVLAAYHEASRRMSGTPGLLGNQLMSELGRSDSYVVVSHWDSWESFEKWEGGADHKDQTAPLREFRDTERARPFEIYKVLASY